MEVYDNDYTKEDDQMLWELHEIRHALAAQEQSSEHINQIGRQIIAQYHLTHLTLISSTDAPRKMP